MTRPVARIDAETQQLIKSGPLNDHLTPVTIQVSLSALQHPHVTPKQLSDLLNTIAKQVQEITERQVTLFVQRAETGQR